ncbi:uncharacterized protein LOC103031569 isoform X7 [Astyanax mexicanus]|uniref:uncharacterized protein LOC103031569 isoform X4 n=1 Tax=Astyanax mexicanus TaxID=7994 RepID=UPI0020CB524D|nr:uncharacterized protein LOC103031569 isoform X4 [Astyanax mexicanus]XP_049324139.1 uncharacterized protein LOC103031569 isoform X5 [Astyanax mexicanus]XP_049324140.1 uncharacterized protein LOC103031569 isoform X6 [Astyanax mexicanus]XP_049324141.1 uncharacterized protein LOC103031569 isoform X7 [Astyanax mexicanus]
MKMLLICGVLLMFTGSAVGLITVDDQCRSDQSCVFYGAVGRRLYLQLPKEEELKLNKIISETTFVRIFQFKNQIIRIKPPDPRWEFNNETKTMIITRAEKEDSGRYELLTFSSAGFTTGIYYLHLIIEAGVSSVKMTNSCFSITERKVHCWSDGDQIQFSWTLDGIPHNQNLTDGNRTLLLDERSTGNFTCTVKNHVSSGSATVIIEPCPETTTAASTTSAMTTTTPPPFNDLLLIMLGLFAVLLIVVAVIVCHIYRKKQAPKTTGSPQNGEELLYVQVNHKPKPKDGEEGTSRPARVQEEEVEYASAVRQPKQKKKKKKEPKEEEVQYGEVVFKTPAKKQREQPEEECVYSQVQHKR